LKGKKKKKKKGGKRLWAGDMVDQKVPQSHQLTGKEALGQAWKTGGKSAWEGQLQKKKKKKKRGRGKGKNTSESFEALTSQPEAVECPPEGKKKDGGTQ